MRALSDFLWRSLRADMFHQVACLPVNLYINCSSVTSVEHSWNDELFLFYNWRQEKRWSVRSEELYCLPTSVAYSDRSFHFFLHVDKLQQHANCLHTFAFGSNIVSIIGSQYRVTWWQLSHQVWQVKWHYRNFPRYTRIELTMPFLFFFFWLIWRIVRFLANCDFHTAIVVQRAVLLWYCSWSNKKSNKRGKKSFYMFSSGRQH